MDSEKIIEELKRAGMTEEDARKLLQKHLKAELLTLLDASIEEVSSSILAKLQL